VLAGAGWTFAVIGTVSLLLVAFAAAERATPPGERRPLGPALLFGTLSVLVHATADAVPYLLLAGVCALTLPALWRSRGSTAWTTRSAPVSSGSSSRTTGAA
jgi:hypothetical protein